MISGTASNALALSSFLRSYGNIICHIDAHINKDEGDQLIMEARKIWLD